jgi:hypothetical protein
MNGIIPLDRLTIYVAESLTPSNPEYPEPPKGKKERAGVLPALSITRQCSKALRAR